VVHSQHLGGILCSNRRVSKGKVANLSKLRLLVVIPELSLGGATRIARDQAAAFAKRYDVTEVFFNLDDGVDYPGLGRLEGAPPRPDCQRDQCSAEARITGVCP
jgi:hypothetical protein